MRFDWSNSVERYLFYLFTWFCPCGVRSNDGCFVFVFIYLIYLLCLIIFLVVSSRESTNNKITTTSSAHGFWAGKRVRLEDDVHQGGRHCDHVDPGVQVEEHPHNRRCVALLAEGSMRLEPGRPGTIHNSSSPCGFIMVAWGCKN